MQTPLLDLKIPVKLEWRQGEDMPFGMSGCVQAVVIGHNVYFGGGYSSQLATVMVYSVETGSCEALPPCETSFFSMAAVDNQLVLVGGVSPSTGKMTNALVAWDKKSHTWTRSFPVMPTARVLPSVVFYQKWLIIAGGKGEKKSSLNKVDLLDTLSGQWYEGSSLPIKSSQMSSAVSGNMWYLSGGYCFQTPNKCVYSVCLDVLISQAVSQSGDSTSSPWQTLPETPLTFSTIVALNGALLAVGGWFSSSIHLYQLGRRSWVKVGDLPSPRWQCTCTVLPNGEMFVAGGYQANFSPSKCLHTVTFITNYT